MKRININLGANSYNIFIGYKILSALGSYIRKLHIGNDAFIITNKTIKTRYVSIIEKALIKNNFSVKSTCVPDSERAKSSSVMLDLIKQISTYDKQKTIFIIAFGGGVVGDLAGFVASIYKRGVPYIQVPTTFLGQIDSSIGGKTAVDLSIGKNLIGAFYQPKLVFSDIFLLNTLNKKEIVSGMAEAIKYGIIKNPSLFEYIENNYSKIISFKRPPLLKVIYECARIKAKIIEQDEKETKGIRTILNLGHTIGHAIEAASKYRRIGHGEAVALGILCACSISNRLKLLNLKDYIRIENIINRTGLPSKIHSIGLGSIIKAHFHDKKFIGKINRFVLPIKIGKVIVKEDIKLDLIKQAIKERLF